MSLVKQLWIGIIFLLVIALGGSFLISTITAQYYLEQQLQLKNIDTATTLALSMSQMEKDEVTIDLLISAQFDTGHFESIRLMNPQGQVIAEHHYTGLDNGSIPDWFGRFLTLEVKPGIAQIQDGWQQYGTLYIQSHSRFAEEALWQSTVRLFQWLLVAALVCGVTGTTILKFITRPLASVIFQAKSIGQRHFISSEEPRTWEFKQLVLAMNKMSASVKEMLEKKTKELQVLQSRSQQDPLTKLPNREHFLNMLDSNLTREDSHTNGSLCIIRILNLANINQTIGHAATDEILLKIAELLFSATNDSDSEGYAGRLNGTDFVVVCFTEESITNTAKNLSKNLIEHMAPFYARDIPLALPVAGCYFHPGESRSRILSRLDGALALAEQKGDHAVIALEEIAHANNRQNLEQWRRALSLALDAKDIKLGNFAVRAVNGDLIHWEKPVRLKLDNDWQPAGYFIGWAVRLKMIELIDLQVLEQALQHISDTGEPTAINMSEGALCSATFRAQAKTLLEQNLDKTEHLWIEFPESCAVRHLPLFRQFCIHLRSFGCRVGLEHVGLEFTQIRELHDIGLHYLKIDSAIIRDIDKLNSNHDFVRSLCAIGHSLGLVMIAEGILTSEEQNTLAELNINGVTGPKIS